MATKRPKAGKVRKPAQFLFPASYNTADYGIYIFVPANSVRIKVDDHFDSEDCRRLAAWLEKAARFLEQREGK